MSQTEDVMQDWHVVWSWKSEHMVAGLCHTGDAVVVATGLDIILINSDGYPAWRTSLPFSSFKIVHGEGMLGVLAGHGFHVLSQNDGRQKHEGRATSGGFSDLLARPGGGWVLSDRKEHLHLFNLRGRGERRLKCGQVRRLLGWFDREHLLIHDSEGLIKCIRMVGEDRQRVVEQRVWSWCSRLEDGRLLMQALDGEIWEGIPHPFGWDLIDRIETLGMEPMAATRVSDGWWVLQMDGSLERLPPLDNEIQIEAGDMLCGDGSTTLVSCTRGGLLRWWEAPDLMLKRRRKVQAEVAQAREEMDWQKRSHMFTTARAAEDDGQLSKAAELYQKLGRSEDVRRILGMKREGV